MLLAQTARMLSQFQQLLPFFFIFPPSFSHRVALRKLCSILHHFAPLCTIGNFNVHGNCGSFSDGVFLKKDLSADVDCSGCSVSSEGGYCLNWGFVASGSLPFRCLTKHWSTQSHLPVVVAALIITGQLFTAISN